MSVHPENLKAGDWVCGYVDLREPATNMWGQSQSFTFDGIPWKVKGVSAPFVAMERDGILITVDLRVVGLTKLSAAYVKAMRQTIVERGDEGKKVVKTRHRKVRTKRDPRDCPRCGQRMVQTIPKDDTLRCWHRVCKDCGYDQGPVEQGVTP